MSSNEHQEPIRFASKADLDRWKNVTSGYPKRPPCPTRLKPTAELHQPLVAALACIQVGVSIIPIDHTTKRPAMHLLPKGENGKSIWKPYQQQPPDEATVRGWFASGIGAFAAVAGRVSGGLLVLDFDVPRFYDAWRSAVGELADGLPVQQTGGGGYQVFLRCENPGGNTQLAWAPNDAEETRRKIAIETRGEGGYVLVPPSLHPSGNQYKMIAGDLANIPTVPQERADALLAAARKLDEAPHTRQERERIEKQAQEGHRKQRAGANGQGGIISEFNAAHPIESLLEKHGYRKGAGGRYVRPGGSNESVAVKEGRSFHWSTNDPLNDGKGKAGCGCHDAFDLFAHFEHGGDVQAAVKSAARALGKEYETEASDGTYYVAAPNGLVFVKPAKDGAGESSTCLTNFIAQIVSNVVEDDGAEQRRTFEIEAKLGGSQHRFSVPADQFCSMNWAMEKMGANAFIYPGTMKKDHARAAIQQLSRATTRTLYTHTGWRKLNGGTVGHGGCVYLHAGGAIGEAGVVSDVEVHLPDPLAGYVLPVPPTGNELVNCIRASLKVIDLGPDHITIPLFCAIYRAALGASDSALYLSGTTGVFKSELAALACQHFGAGMDRPHLPASWSGTDNALEGLAFAAKDTLLPIDDFAPGGGVNDMQRLHQKADRVLRAQGNRSGRARMRADGSLRPIKPPRGLILSTGEDIPKGQSIRARMMVVELVDGDIPKDKLTARQQDARAGLYAGAMAGYVRFLASRIEGIQQNMDAERAKLRDKAATSSMHRRTPDIVANLALGLRTFLDYAKEAGAITDAQGATLWANGWKALGHAAERQASHQASMEPTRRFLELLSSALASGRAHLAGPNGSQPVDASGVATPAGGAPFGWRGMEPRGDRIGWVDGDSLYLDSDASYKAAQQMAPNGDGLVIQSQTLWKRMDEKGLLIREGKRDELRARRVLEGVQRKVIHLRLSSLMGVEPATPAKPDSDPDSEGENGD